MQINVKSILKQGGAVALVFLILCVITSNSERLYNKAYRWDAAGYHAYLPAVLIYNDMSFDFHKKESGHPKGEFYRGKDKKINRYSLGVAFLQAPFFGIAHLTSKFFDRKSNGYSVIYKKFLAFGAIFYASLGLLFLGFTLNRYFSVKTSNLAIIAVGFATNLVYYTILDLMMSHVYSFFLFSVTMWVGMKWKDNYKSKYFYWLCILGGLIASVRITNIIFLLVPLLWGVKTFDDIIKPFKVVFSKKHYFFIGIVLLLIPILPQVWYIYSQTGSMSSPYGSEPFFWSDPLIWKVLFSYRKGWFVWSPILFFGLIGWIYGKKHPVFWGAALFMVINLYVISSWWCWWYGGSFGMRALIESSVLMSFGIAFFIDKILKKRYIVFSIILTFFIGLNVLQTHQYYYNIIHFDAMTKASYWTIFGHTHPLSPEVLKKKNEELDYTNAYKTIHNRQYRKDL